MSDPLDVQPDVAADAPVEPAPPIESRFLFVDVASQRANQLRRGARIRLTAHLPHKLERAAMDEVRHGLIQYAVPDLPTSRAQE